MHGMMILLVEIVKVHNFLEYNSIRNLNMSKIYIKRVLIVKMMSLQKMKRFKSKPPRKLRVTQ